MNGFDLLILAMLALFVALGAWRGLLSEVISLLTWASRQTSASRARKSPPLTVS